jgi:hypothetical protein
MNKRTLTDAAVLSMAAPDLPSHKHWNWCPDGALPGHGLKVYGSGSKRFALRYRTAQGRSRMITIGSPGEFSVEESRALAREFKQQAARGVDPAASLRGESVSVYHVGPTQGGESRLFLRIRDRATRDRIMDAIAEIVSAGSDGDDRTREGE